MPISDFLEISGINLNQRNNIIKVRSQTHNRKISHAKFTLFGVHSFAFRHFHIVLFLNFVGELPHQTVFRPKQQQQQKKRSPDFFKPSTNTENFKGIEDGHFVF